MNKLTIGAFVSALSLVFVTGCFDWDPYCDGYYCDDPWYDYYECYSSAGCGGSDVCVAHNCVSAWYQYYTLDNLTAFVDSTVYEWDPMGNAPDLVVCVHVDGDSYGCTDVKKDSYGAYWTDFFDFAVYSGSVIDVVMYDYDDLSGDELMVYCPIDVTLSVLRSDGEPYSCYSNTGAEISFSISAK